MAGVALGIQHHASGQPLNDKSNALRRQARSSHPAPAVEAPEEGAGRDGGHDPPVEHRLHWTVGRVRHARDGDDRSFAFAARPESALIGSVGTLCGTTIPRASQALAAAVFTSPNAERLRTALELYGSHFYERQARTRFLLLVMALEVLAVPTQRSMIVCKVVALLRWA